MSHFCFFPFLTLNLLALFTPLRISSAHLFCASTRISTHFAASRCLRHRARLDRMVKLSLATSAAALAKSRAIESNICFIFLSFYLFMSHADSAEITESVSSVSSVDYSCQRDETDFTEATRHACSSHPDGSEGEATRLCVSLCFLCEIIIHWLIVRGYRGYCR